MKFGRVQGHGNRADDSDRLTIIVALDSSAVSRIVRDESVPWLAFGPENDVTWQIDQYTQETIGSTLAEEGWEAISADPRQTDVSDGFYHSATYVVRQMSAEPESDQ